MDPSEKDNSSNSGEDYHSSQAYRLVPIDEEQTYKYKRVSIRKLLGFYWDKRKIVYWCTGVFLAISLIFAFFNQVEYEATASIIPEYELQDKVNEVIETFGLFLGLDGDLEKSSPNGLLEQYPYMINSVSFQKQLMHKSFYYNEVDSTITIYQYFTQIYSPSPMQKIYKYTLGLPTTIGDGWQAQKHSTISGDSAARDSLFQIIDLSSRERKVINQLSGRITAKFERRAGLIRIKTRMPEPTLAAKLAQLTLGTLQQRARKYKTGKARLYKESLARQAEQAKKDLEKARASLIDFKNNDSQPLNKRMALQSRYNSALDRYNTISRILARIKLTIKEQLPSFRILDDITIPDQHSSPNRILIITLGLLLGLFVAFCWITAVFFASTLRGETPKP